MPALPDVSFLSRLLQQLEDWILTSVLSIDTLVQIAVVLAAYAVARAAAPRLERWLRQINVRRLPEGLAQQLVISLKSLILPAAWLVLVGLSKWIAVYADLPSYLLRLVVSLLAAWIVIRLTSAFVRNASWSRLIAVSVWIIAALNILGLLTATMAFLDSIGFEFAGVRISAFTVIRGLAALAILLWLAVTASQLAERRIRRLGALTPSLQVLSAKLVKVLLIVVAVITALGSAGINLTAFTVFSGAIGLGIGFGLQKVVSNLISGVILLLDRSIKPGDVIAIGETYGWIQSLGARYVSVVTRDGTEHLIPNEELITQRVENWSYSNSLVRLKSPIGISYNADLHKAIGLILEAAQAAPRVLAIPHPTCLLKGFGDSSVDLELRFWINDPNNGVSNVKSDILLGVWDRFHEHGIEIPFPQRDLHLRSAIPLPLSGDRLPVAEADRSADDDRLIPPARRPRSARTTSRTRSRRNRRDPNPGAS
jgi:small-conductance mechanosensitive channel